LGNLLESVYEEEQKDVTIKLRWVLGRLDESDSGSYPVAGFGNKYVEYSSLAVSLLV
jgi:hypothetical protein